MEYVSVALLIIIVITVASVLNMLKRFQDDNGEHRDCEENDHCTEGTWRYDMDEAGCAPETGTDEHRDVVAESSPGFPFSRCLPHVERRDFVSGRHHTTGEDGYDVVEDTCCSDERHWTDSRGQEYTEKTDFAGNRSIVDGDGNVSRESTNWRGEHITESDDGHKVVEWTDWGGRRHIESDDGSEVVEWKDWDGNSHFE